MLETDFLLKPKPAAVKNARFPLLHERFSLFTTRMPLYICTYMLLHVYVCKRMQLHGAARNCFRMPIRI